jgi:murein L,D-transpeptidase YcbB/YkuD
VRVPLKTSVPVSVAYWTAFVDPDGTVEFRPDLYGWDRMLLARLAQTR